MEILISAALGLAFGHAMDLLFLRFYTSTDLSEPLYRCPACRSPFTLPFAIPLFGYVANAGRCPGCSAGLPLRAVFLPIGGALLFAASYLVFDDLGGGLLGGIFATIFLTLTFTDMDRRLLPNRIVYPSIVLAIGLSWGWPGNSVAEVLAGGAVAIAIAGSLLLLSLPFGAGAFGMGDVKMIVLIGFVVGLPSVLVGVAIATFAAALVSLVLIATRIKGRKDYIPHGPFLAIGAIVALFWGAELWDAYRGQ